jgi:hypothetical protein
MERTSGLEEAIRIPTGQLRQPRSWSDAYKKKANDLAHGHERQVLAPKPGPRLEIGRGSHKNRSSLRQFFAQRAARQPIATLYAASKAYIANHLESLN